jgi:hypothetical protein
MSASADKDAIAALVIRYLGCFNAADFETAFACYRMPFTWLFGAHAASVASREAFMEMMRKSKAGLARQGLAESRLVDIAVNLRSEHVALASLTVDRLRLDGTVLERISGAYLVHNDGGGWRLAAYWSDPDAAA